jgi:hypothetical protein
MNEVLQLKNTPAEKDYNGCGWGWLIVKNGNPELLVYHPERMSKSKPDSTNYFIRIDDKHLKEITETTKIYFGMVSCYEFVVFDKVEVNQ